MERSGCKRDCKENQHTKRPREKFKAVQPTGHHGKFGKSCSLKIVFLPLFFLNAKKYTKKKAPPLSQLPIWVGFHSECRTAVPDNVSLPSSQQSCPCLGCSPACGWFLPAAPSRGACSREPGARGRGLQGSLFPVAGRRVSCLISKTFVKLVATHNMIYRLSLTSLLRLPICISAGAF